jgi:hypothetical protein
MRRILSLIGMDLVYDMFGYKGNSFGYYPVSYLHQGYFTGNKQADYLCNNTLIITPRRPDNYLANSYGMIFKNVFILIN